MIYSHINLIKVVVLVKDLARIYCFAWEGEVYKLLGYFALKFDITVVFIALYVTPSWVWFRYAIYEFLYKNIEALWWFWLINL